MVRWHNLSFLFDNLALTLNSTGEFRNAFLKTIRQIIRESVRNMNIPPLATSAAGTSTAAAAAAAAGSMSRLPSGKPAPPLRSEATRLLGHMGGGQAGGHPDATMTLQLRGKRQQPHQVRLGFNARVA